MDRLKLLLREPALLAQLVENAIAVLLIINITVSKTEETAIMAAIIAVNALVKGLSTHPFPVHFITDAARAILMCGVAFNLPLSADKVTVLVTFLGTVTTIVGTLRTTPAYDPVVRPGGAGGGPVTTRTEAGYANYGFLGIVLIVLGIVLLLLTAWQVVGIILIIVGIVVFLLPYGTHRGV